jgi:hypothetical protein
VVLGGMGSQLGVILAAILLTVLPEVAREFAEYRMLIFGLVMVLMMMWRPQACCPQAVPTWSCRNERRNAESLRPADALRRPAGRRRHRFDVRREEVFAIIGPNGAGKTTVFNCISGFTPTAGEIALDGQ